jgi:hypothetical protein
LKAAYINEEKYDLVICDPPTLFDTVEQKRVFSCNKEYDRLVEHAIQVVKPGGKLLLFCNSHSIKYDKWFDMVTAGLERGGKGYSVVGTSCTRNPFHGNHSDGIVSCELRDVAFKLRVSEDFFEVGNTPDARNEIGNSSAQHTTHSASCANADGSTGVSSCGSDCGNSINGGVISSVVDDGTASSSRSSGSGGMESNLKGMVIQLCPVA